MKLGVFILRKFRIAGLPILFVVTVSGCVSNKPSLTVCSDLHDSLFVCEERHENKASKIVDDFLTGAESSATKREKDRNKRHLPPKEYDKGDVISGIFNSIFSFLGRLF